MNAPVSVLMTLLATATASSLYSSSGDASRVVRPESIHVNAAPRCDKIDTPNGMPSLNALFDSAGLVSRLQAVDSGAANELKLSINYSDSSTGHIMDKAPETIGNLSMLTIALSSLRKGTSGAPSAFRVAIKRGPRVQVKLEKSVLCGPVGNGVASVGGERKLAFTVTSVNGQSGLGSSAPKGRDLVTLPPNAHARVRIDAEGHVTQFEIIKGTGSTDNDARLRESYLKTRYEPAELDGKPVAVWVADYKVELAK